MCRFFTIKSVRKTPPSIRPYWSSASNCCYKLSRTARRCEMNVSFPAQTSAIKWDSFFYIYIKEKRGKKWICVSYIYGTITVTYSGGRYCPFAKTSVYYFPIFLSLWVFFSSSGCRKEWNFPLVKCLWMVVFREGRKKIVHYVATNRSVIMARGGDPAPVILCPMNFKASHTITKSFQV